MRKLTLAVALTALVLVTGSSATLAALRVDSSSLFGAAHSSRIVVEYGAARLAWLNEELYADVDSADQLGSMPRSERLDDLLNAALSQIVPSSSVGAGRSAFCAGGNCEDSQLSAAQTEITPAASVEAVVMVWDPETESYVRAFDQFGPLPRSVREDDQLNAALSQIEPTSLDRRGLMWDSETESYAPSFGYATDTYVPAFDAGRSAACAGGDCIVN